MKSQDGQRKKHFLQLHKRLAERSAHSNLPFEQGVCLGVFLCLCRMHVGKRLQHERQFEAVLISARSDAHVLHSFIQLLNLYLPSQFFHRHLSELAVPRARTLRGINARIAAAVSAVCSVPVLRSLGWHVDLQDDLGDRGQKTQPVTADLQLRLSTQ